MKHNTVGRRIVADTHSNEMCVEAGRLSVVIDLPERLT
jgi:hypothetical protein